MKSKVYLSDRAKHTRNLIMSAMIATLAWISVFVFRINVSFLTGDIKNAIITIGGLVCGTFWVIPMSLVTCFLEMISISDTGFYGFLMNFAATASFAFVACAIYNRFKTLSSALFGLLFASITMTGFMLLLNLVVTPLYLTVKVKDVIKIIPSLLLPFNLTKAVLNSAIILLLYKPFINTLRKAGIIKGTGTVSVNKDGTVKASGIRSESIVSLVVGAGLFIISLVIFFWFFKAKVDFF